MSKILVVVYSRTGTCSRLARLLRNQQPGWELGQIRLQDPREGRAGYWRCVLDSVLRRKPAIRYEGPSPRRFDAVVLVSPIWAFRLAGPMRSFVVTWRDQLSDIAVISVMGGAGGPNAVHEIERLTGRPAVMASAFTMQDVLQGAAGTRLAVFGEALRSAVDAKLEGESKPPLSAQAA